MKRNRAAVTITFGFLKIIFLILAVFVLISLGKDAYSFGYRVFAEETVSKPPGKDVAVTVGKGISPSDLGEMLERKGLIKDGKVFWLQMMLSEYKDQVKEGSYVLNTSQTSEEMLAVLAGDQEQESETEE